MLEIKQALAKYPAYCQPQRIEALGSAGGMSGAQFWRIQTAFSPEPAASMMLVLRRWPIEHPTPERLRFIHGMLAHAASGGIQFLPVPILTRDGNSFVDHAGHLWELAPWMPGAANYAHAPSVEKLRAAMTALAQFHVAVSNFNNPLAPGSAGGSSAVKDRLSRLQELVHGGHKQLARAITDNVWPELAPLARQFLAALPSALPRAIALHEPLANESFSLQPCLRDIWHDHVLFTGNHVTGIIDFGAMDIDTPACDVARLLGSLVGDDVDNRETGVAAYSRVRPLSNNELRAVAAFDTSITLLAGCNWIRWIYIEGRQFENPAQILQRFQRLVDRTHMIASVQHSD